MNNVFKLKIFNNGKLLEEKVFNTYSDAWSYNWKVSYKYHNATIHWFVNEKPLYFRQRIYIFHYNNGITSRMKLNHYLSDGVKPLIMDVIPLS